DTASLYSGSLSRPQALSVAAAASAPTVQAIVGSLGSADTEPEPPELINRWEPYGHVMVLREISKRRAAVERAARPPCAVGLNRLLHRWLRRRGGVTSDTAVESAAMQLLFCGSGWLPITDL